MRGAIPLLPNTPPWHVAQLKSKGKFITEHIKTLRKLRGT